MSVGLRDWDGGDAAAVAAIYAPYVARTTISFEFDPPDAAEIARRLGALRAQGYPVRVAELAGAVVGYAYAGVFRARPAYAATVEHSVYVREDLRRRGIGRILLVDLLERCRERGYAQVVAGISDPLANPGSVGLHRALGFAEVGLLPGVGRKFGRDLDLLFMQRGLRDAVPGATPAGKTAEVAGPGA